VSVNASDCWDLRELAGIHAGSGMAAVRAAMAPGPGGPARRSAKPALVYPTGFTLSPFAETGAPGAPLKAAPRGQWRYHKPAGSYEPGQWS
jgi:error-prone DNA polymerase